MRKTSTQKLILCSNTIFWAQVKHTVMLCERQFAGIHYSDVTWPLNDHVTAQLLVQQFVHVNIKENIMSLSLAFCEGNPMVTSGFPSQKANNKEIVSMPWLGVGGGDSTVTVTSGFPSQRASNAEIVSKSWHHHEETLCKACDVKDYNTSSRHQPITIADHQR